MTAVSNRTFICSVLFLDIVGYSRKPVAEQIRLKERLNALLTEALANVAVNDRIILDTGDGAALNFLGDPEDALFVALSIRDALATPSPHGPDLTLRVGINLGPVKLIKDINSQPNIIGDGINVAQRVMSFAEPGQILVSRSYHEVVSRLSDDFAKLFHFQGSRTDKHVREHEVYAVEAAGRSLPPRLKAGVKTQADSASAGAVLDHLSASASRITNRLHGRPRLSAALAATAVILVAVGIRAGRQPVTVPLKTDVPPRSAVAIAPAPKATEVPAPPGTQEPAASAKEPAKPAAERKSPPAKPQAPATTPPRTAEGSSPQAQPPAQTGSGVVLFTVNPWAEIYVDGKRRGDVPPLFEIPISAGQHTIELRHPDFPPYVRTVMVKPGARIDVRHTFLPKEHPNPLRKILPWN